MAHGSVSKRKRDEFEASAAPDDSSDGMNDESDSGASSIESDSSKLSNEDEEEPDGRYDAAKEDLPFHVSYHPALNEIKYGVVKELGQYTMFDNGSPPCPDMEPVLQRYQAAKFLPNARPTTIGLIGGAGAGCTLVELILPQGASGSSCTSVVTEFCAAPPEQTDTFAAEIVYLERPQAEQLLRHQLSDILLLRHAEEEKWTKIELNEYRQKATTAITTFSTIFPDIPGFESEKLASKTLANVSEKTSADFLRPLLLRCGELISANANSHFTATSAKKLNKRLATYTRPNASNSKVTGEPGLWPLVEKVKITLRDWHVCNGLRHLIFADLPGLQDENLVRVQSANAYLTKCDAVWIVTSISRVKDNSDTARLLEDAIARHPNKVALVVTNSDTNLNLQTFTGLQGLPLDFTDCHNKHQKTKDLEKRLGKIEKRLKAKLDRTIKSDLSEAKRILLAELEDTRLEFSVQLMKVRNESVVLKMREDTNEKVPKGTRLPVYCVANDFYQKLRDFGCKQLKFSAVETNIPALRCYALSLPTTSIYKSLKKYVQGPYYVFLEGLQAWAHGEYVGNSQELIDMIREKQKLAIARVHQYNTDMDAMVEDLVFKKLAQNASEYSETALNVSNRFQSSYSWHKFRQICKSQGLLNRPKEMKISWNEMLAECIFTALNEQWTLTRNKQSMGMGMAAGEIVGHMRSISFEMKKLCGGDSRLEDVSKTVEIQVQKIQDIMMEDFVELNALERDLASQMTKDVHGSMVVKFMKSTYEKCGAEYGKGLKLRMCRRMHDHMSQKGNKSFANQILTMTKNGYYAGRRKGNLLLVNEIDAMFNSISVNLQLMTTVKTEYSSGVEEIRQDIAKRVEPALEIYYEMEETMKALESAASGFDF
ncbi:hypothetical protein FH972_022347 [Carpinus fangiana]|uniref:DUF7605 domain-containing protein n=1 Tax=Carpinus fangiana TaxID=176857 RepID=A0A5N6KSD2_9ROSI|nr:hypothetical protein FH972_022347 [Carpinus fangiana]